MNQEIFLMNFRIPSGLKMQFEETCHQLRTNMTAEMNRMIRDFVKQSKEDLYEPVGWFYGNGGDDDMQPNKAEDQTGTDQKFEQDQDQPD